MEFLPPASIKAIADPRGLALLVALAAIALVSAGEAAHHPTAALGLFGALLAMSWMLTATVITYLCSGHGLVLQPPELNGDFHALSQFPVRIRLGNTRSRRPALFLTVWLDTFTDKRILPSPPKFLGRLDPRANTMCAWEITARRRGPHELRGARVRTSFPGSLGAYEYDFPFFGELLARPAIFRLDRQALQLLIRRRQAAGRMGGMPASMEEFAGVRDYRPGDNPRDVHLALSMRRPDYPIDLVVREFEDPRDDDICIVLDTAILPAEANDALLQYQHEKSLSFAVAFCRLLVEYKYRVRFCATGDEGQNVNILLDRTSRKLPDVEVALARLRPVRDHQPVLDLLDYESRRSTAAVLFISLRDAPDETRRAHQAVLSVEPRRQTSLVREVVGQ